MASSCTPSAKSSIVNTVNDEKFEEIYRPNEGAVQLVDNGRVCEKNIAGSFGCTLGKHSFSSGIHRIRIRADYGDVFLGVRSRNILPVPNDYAWGRYDCNPSAYGWLKNHGRICNGRYIFLDLKQIDRNTHVFALTLDFDEHRLSILNEDTKEQDELEVDILHAPLPWCLFVQLPRTKARVSLL